jgi:hypothetical protein
MANPPPYLGTGDDTGVEPDREATTATSRWQKVVGIIGLVVILGLGALMFRLGGGHAPGQNTPDQNREQQIGPHDPSKRDHR